jgi:hypothetical protein
VVRAVRAESLAAASLKGWMDSGLSTAVKTAKAHQDQSTAAWTVNRAWTEEDRPAYSAAWMAKGWTAPAGRLAESLGPSTAES